jgi:hypothetical protein
MGQLRLQQSLFVDAGEFVGTAHRKAPKSRVWLAQNLHNMPQGISPWKQHGHTLPVAIQQATAWQAMGAADCYAMINGGNWLAGYGRTVSAVQSLNGFYVDFDRYKTPAYCALPSEDFLNAVLADNPWLPAPTVFVDSGNGCWMFWLFTRPLRLPSKETWLEQWQLYQDFLIRKLARYGADPACADAARVVRIAGTLNSKTSREAKAWATSERYEFAALKEALNQEYRRDRVHSAPKQKVSNKPRVTSKESGKVSGLLNLHTLAHSRMTDLKTLAFLRGGRLTDSRRMASWIYAVSAAHFCRSEDSLRAEVESFISECVSEPEKYLKAVNYQATVDRFNNEQRLIEGGSSRKEARDLLGREGSQYTLSNAYIIRLLDIDPAEQRKLKTIIGPDEKRARHSKAEAGRRRAAGAATRAEYLGRVDRLREQAQELHRAGESVRAISRQLGIPLSSTHRYLQA